MAVTVVAVLVAKPGRAHEIVEAFREVSPLVHDEAGCEVYAAHLEQNGDAVVMVERWSSKEALDAHASGAPLRRLNTLIQDVLAKPYDAWFLDPISLGDPAKSSVW